jgi:hypothetical protein
MANVTAARAHVEVLLREKKLDGTLTSSALWTSEAREARVVSTGWAEIDAPLGGGFPRGECSEIVGARSTGRTTVLCALLASAAARGELVALVDPCDRFDPLSAAELGLDLDRLLWVRGVTPEQAPEKTPGKARGKSFTRLKARAREEADAQGRRLDRAIKAFGLILQAGGFGVVAIDLADVASPALRRLPFTTWRRLQRLLEGRDTVGLLLAAEPLGRSARGMTLRLTAGDEGAHQRWVGESDRARLFEGFTFHPHVHCAHRLEGQRPEPRRFEAQRLEVHLGDQSRGAHDLEARRLDFGTERFGAARFGA